MQLILKLLVLIEGWFSANNRKNAQKIETTLVGWKYLDWKTPSIWTTLQYYIELTFALCTGIEVRNLYICTLPFGFQTSYHDWKWCRQVWRGSFCTWCRTFLRKALTSVANCKYGQFPLMGFLLLVMGACVSSSNSHAQLISTLSLFIVWSIILS